MFSNLWKTTTIGAGIGLVLVLAWAMRLDSLRGSWEKKFATLDGQSQSVLMATRQASDNPLLKWEGVPAQISALSATNVALKGSIAESNSKVATLDAETVRLKHEGDVFRAQAATAQASRRDAADKLATLATQPGDRANCSALISQVTTALDLAWSSGL